MEGVDIPVTRLRNANTKFPWTGSHNPCCSLIKQYNTDKRSLDDRQVYLGTNKWFKSVQIGLTKLKTKRPNKQTSSSNYDMYNISVKGAFLYTSHSKCNPIQLHLEYGQTVRDIDIAFPTLYSYRESNEVIYLAGLEPTNEVVVFQQAGKFGDTLLYCICSNGITMNASGNKYQKGFLDAVRNGDTAELKKILECREGKVNVNSFDTEGQTALHQSCMNGNLKLVKLLVKFGADTRLANSDGWNPLHIAAFSGHQDITLYLLHANRTIPPKR